MFNKREQDVKQSYVGGRIDSNACVVGHFTQVYDKTAASGSKAIHFDFVADDGREASFDLWYYSAKSDSNIEFTIDLIETELMVLLKANSLQSKKNHPVSVYDWDLKANVDKLVDGYPAFENVPIGIVFQLEAYKRTNPKNGDWFGQSVRPVKYFSAKTRQTAFEAINKIDANEIDAYIAKQPELFIPKALRAEYGKGQDVVAQVNELAQSQPKTATYVPHADDFEDDIPF